LNVNFIGWLSCVKSNKKTKAQIKIND
jgi:hypothetical protein